MHSLGSLTACRKCGPELAASLQCQHVQKWRNYSGGLVCAFPFTIPFLLHLTCSNYFFKKKKNPIRVYKLPVLYSIPGKLPDILTLFWKHAKLQKGGHGSFSQMPVKNTSRDCAMRSWDCSNWYIIGIIHKLVKDMSYWMNRAEKLECKNVQANCKEL